MNGRGGFSRSRRGPWWLEAEPSILGRRCDTIGHVLPTFDPILPLADIRLFKGTFSQGDAQRGEDTYPSHKYSYIFPAIFSRVDLVGDVKWKTTLPRTAEMIFSSG